MHVRLDEREQAVERDWYDEQDDDGADAPGSAKDDGGEERDRVKDDARKAQ